MPEFTAGVKRAARDSSGRRDCGTIAPRCASSFNLKVTGSTMVHLVVGVVLFSLIHLVPAIAPAFRRGLVSRLGLVPFKIVFAVAAIASVVVIVRGWKAALGPVLYAPPAWGWHVTPLFVLAAFVLFASGNAPSNLKRRLRHPQLAGVKFWAFGHLLANGEWRSVVLFGGLLAWAVVEMILINRREGAWVKPAPVSRVATTVTTLGGVVAYIAVMFAHRWLFGVTPFPPG